MSRPHTVGGRDAYARTRPGMGGAFATRGGTFAKAEFEPWVKQFNDFAAAHSDRIRPISFGGGNLFCDRGQINLTRPANSPVLLDNLARSGGGRADDKTALFADTSDPDYQQLLAILERARRALHAHPRIDMPGGKPIAQERRFGVTFGARTGR
jgi:hypothetical protein